MTVLKIFKTVLSRIDFLSGCLIFKGGKAKVLFENIKLRHLFASLPSGIPDVEAVEAGS